MLAEKEYTFLEAPRYSCALGGAYMTVLGMEKVVPILHAGGGCGILQTMGMAFAGGFNSVTPLGGNATPCTALLEKHVVFGGEEKLKEQIRSTVKIMKGELYVILSGCIPSIIGDDVDSVIQDIRRGTDFPPLIHAKTPGFAGNSYDGYEIFFDAVIKQLLEESERKEKGLVNILGIVPVQHLFWKGDLLKIKEVLGKLGLKANLIFLEFSGLAALKKIPSAELTIVLSPWVGIKNAKKIEERFGVPYIVFSGVPIGPKQTSEFLYRVAEQLDIPEESVDRVVAEEERFAYRQFERLADGLVIFGANSPIAVAADSNIAISLTKFLTNECGMLPMVVIITDTPPIESQESIATELTEGLDSVLKPEVHFETDSYKIREILGRYKFVTIYASSQEKYLAQNEWQSLHLSVSFPSWDRVIVERSYAGYRGGIVLLEDILSKAVVPFV